MAARRDGHRARKTGAMAIAKKTAPKSVPRKKPAPRKKLAPRKIGAPPGAPDPSLLADLIKWAKTAGADAAAALYVNGESISVAQRLGAREKLEGSEGRDLRLSVYIGKRLASVSSTDFSPKAMRALVERAVDMAREVPEDPDCGIAGGIAGDGLARARSRRHAPSA